jgi:lysophospholipase L1-like esterase
VPTGKGITHAFINAKVASEDYTATMIVQLGNSVPVKPLPYVAALRNVDAKPVKDAKARAKIATLELRTASATRFVGQKVYHFGDSITEGTQGGYVKYIQGIVQCMPTNYGSSGARTGRLVAIATDQPNRQEVGGAAINPDYTGVVAVTIMIGTNDIASPGTIGTLADIPTQSLQSLPFTSAGGASITTANEYWALFPNTFYGNLGLVIEYIKYRNSKTLIYLISPPHQNGADMAVISTALAAIAKHYSVRFIHAQDEAGLEKKQLTKYSYDGTHLNTLGNELWGKYVGHRLANS